MVRGWARSGRSADEEDRPMKVRMALGALIACLPLCFACSTPGAKDTAAEFVAVTVAADGRVTFRGRDVPPEKLAQALKSAGIPPATRIDVTVPADVPAESLKPLVTRLATAGYRKVLLVRPQHAESFSGSKDSR
jgi:hypothetical protein